MIELLASVVVLLASAILKTTRALLAARDGFEDHRSYHEVTVRGGSPQLVIIDEGREADFPPLVGSI